MEHVRQKFYLLRRTKFSETLKAMGRKFLKCISTYCTKCNKINFNALCDAYTAQIQSYTMLKKLKSKSNRKFDLKLGITFENYFLMVSNEGDHHVWLYFVYYLNCLLIYEEIDC